MQIEFELNKPDELRLGFFLAYGADQNDETIHLTEIGFLFFSVTFTRYV